MLVMIPTGKSGAATVFDSIYFRFKRAIVLLVAIEHNQLSSHASDQPLLANACGTGMIHFSLFFCAKGDQ